MALQNGRYDQAATRLVAGQEVVLNVFNIATVLGYRLGAPLASLADQDSRMKLVGVLDEFLSQV